MALPPVAGFNCDGLTVISGLVLSVLLVSVTLLAVIVKVPLALNVFVKLRVPATKAAFAGSVADASLEKIRIMSVAVLIRFQFASTAFTVTLNTVATTWFVGVPVLPVALPGAAVSPGTSNCNFA